MEVRHALQGVRLQGGKVPGIEVDDSPAGRRWVIGHAVRSGDDGVVTRESGVFEADVGPIPAEDAKLHAAAAAAERKRRGEPPRGPVSVVSEELARRVSLAEPGEPVQVVMFLSMPDLPDVHVAIQRAIGLGEIDDEADLLEAETSLHDLRRSRIAEGQGKMLGRQRVYYAVLGEDDARDDSGALLGPQWSPATCGGVAPLSWNQP